MPVSGYRLRSSRAARQSAVGRSKAADVTIPFGCAVGSPAFDDCPDFRGRRRSPQVLPLVAVKVDGLVGGFQSCQSSDSVGGENPIGAGWPDASDNDI